MNIELVWKAARPTLINGRLILAKGVKPWKVVDLREVVKYVEIIGSWNVASLGKVFFESPFSCSEDLQDFGQMIHGF